jgi:hypothetical protein
MVAASMNDAETSKTALLRKLIMALYPKKYECSHVISGNITPQLAACQTDISTPVRSREKGLIRLMSRRMMQVSACCCVERKIVWAEGQIRATRGVIWTSGAPNNFARPSDSPNGPIHYSEESEKIQKITKKGQKRNKTVTRGWHNCPC